MNEYLRPNLEHLTEVRIIEFTNNSVKVSLDLRKEPEIEIQLIKANKSINGLTQLFENLKPAYNDFLAIKKEKLNDIKKLFNYIVLPEGTTFYSNEYFKIKEEVIPKEKTSEENVSKLCSCNGKCVIRCVICVNQIIKVALICVHVVNKFAKIRSDNSLK
jgi:hypothetical protein